MLRAQQLLGRVFEDLVTRHGRMNAIPEQVPIRPLADGIHEDEEGQARILRIGEVVGLRIGNHHVQQRKDVQRRELDLRQRLQLPEYLGQSGIECLAELGSGADGSRSGQLYCRGQSQIRLIRYEK